MFRTHSKYTVGNWQTFGEDREQDRDYEYQAKEFGLQSLDKKNLLKGCVYKGQEQGREEKEKAGNKDRQTAKPCPELWLDMIDLIVWFCSLRVMSISQTWD